MAQVTPNPHEDDVDSTHSSNSADSDDDVNPPSVEGLTVLDDSTESPPQEQDTGTEREGTNNNESQVIHEVARSPNHALDEIKKQQTHNLYCPKCKSNITTDAVLFVKNQETDSYKTEPYVLWVPLVIPAIKFPTFDLSLSFLAGPWKKLKTLVANCLPSLNSPRLRFLLVAVLLLLSVIVLWSSHPPSPPPLPPPPSPSPVPVPPPPGPPSPSPSPEPPSPSPVPVPPPPGPPSPSPSPEPPSPSPIIHFLSMKYLSVFSLLFLAILTLPWPSISPIINNLIAAIKTCITFCLNSLILCWNDDSKLCFPSCFLILDSPLNQESNPVVEPPQPPVVIDEATRIRISVPNPKELWKYIVVQVQNLVPRELDILKSIVYGGLIESITSLGVVSSAIASGASTLNVISLGLASLSSGLFIIVHNVSRSVSSLFFFLPAKGFKTLRQGTLQSCGCSRCIFGLRDLTLLCQKAYAFRMGRVKTVAEYTGMAIGASALSFIASQIASDIFEKLGFHELASEYRKG
ncbi:predicted protein [Arabidopsis lyrata subsp. lyrata]|uniref:Predicted protein n=1 Tax=Arabidopsis lyrata subsp. lyrata TaxID=81972 RepID=D7MDR0_ARALL|nr:predicted protein [Arabidopsis lyrata subsp. lyrata]